MLVSVKQQQRVTITSVWLCQISQRVKDGRQAQEVQTGKGIEDPVDVAQGLASLPFCQNRSQTSELK